MRALTTTLAGLLILGAAACAAEPTVTATEPAEVEAPKVTAYQVAAALPDAEVQAFCEAAAAAVRMSETPEQAERFIVDAFTEGYGEGRDPSATEVLAEVLNRCIDEGRV